MKIYFFVFISGTGIPDSEGSDLTISDVFEGKIGFSAFEKFAEDNRAPKTKKHTIFENWNHRARALFPKSAPLFQIFTEDNQHF